MLRRLTTTPWPHTLVLDVDKFPPSFGELAFLSVLGFVFGLVTEAVVLVVLLK